MFEVWMKLQFWDFLFGVSAICIFIVVIFTCAAINSFSWKRKIGWLKRHDFERYLVSVSMFGNGESYGWKNEITGEHISEHELKFMNYKELVERFG